MGEQRFRWRHYAYTARKYFRMNPFRHWWVLHVWDELRADLCRDDRERAKAFRDGIRSGRRSAAADIRSAVLELLRPDDQPARDHALRQCVEIAERDGDLDPIPTAERTRPHA